jgi:hypothetical protein
MLTSEERPSAPSDYVTAWILFWHKLEGRSEIYRASDFDIPGDRELDLTRHSTFSGLNIWTQQVGSRMKMPALRWLPVAALLLLGYLAIQVAAAFRAATRLTISEAVRT